LPDGVGSETPGNDYDTAQHCEDEPLRHAPFTPSELPVLGLKFLLHVPLAGASDPKVPLKVNEDEETKAHDHTMTADHATLSQNVVGDLPVTLASP